MSASTCGSPVRGMPPGPSDFSWLKQNNMKIIWNTHTSLLYTSKNLSALYVLHVYKNAYERKITMGLIKANIPCTSQVLANLSLVSVYKTLNTHIFLNFSLTAYADKHLFPWLLMILKVMQIFMSYKDYFMKEFLWKWSYFSKCVSALSIFCPVKLAAIVWLCRPECRCWLNLESVSLRRDWVSP